MTSGDFPTERSRLLQKSQLVSWLIKHSGGLVKNEKQANVFLLFLVFAAITFSLFLLSDGGVVVSPEALENPEYGLPVKD